MSNVNAIRKNSIVNLRHENKTKLFNNLMDKVNGLINRCMVESLEDQARFSIKRDNFLVGYMVYQELKLAGWNVEVEFFGGDYISHLVNPEKIEEFFETASEKEEVDQIIMSLS